MSHNKPRANAPWTYCRKTRRDSVAGAFAAYEDSEVLPPDIEAINNSRYRGFCVLAHDGGYRASIFCRAGSRMGLWGLK